MEDLAVRLVRRGCRIARAAASHFPAQTAHIAVAAVGGSSSDSGVKRTMSNQLNQVPFGLWAVQQTVGSILPGRKSAKQFEKTLDLELWFKADTTRDSDAHNPPDPRRTIMLKVMTPIGLVVATAVAATAYAVSFSSFTDRVCGPGKIVSPLTVELVWRARRPLGKGKSDEGTAPPSCCQTSI